MATTVTVYFATNRQPITDGGEKIVDFSSELGPTSGLDVRYGRAEVAVDVVKNTKAMDPKSLNVADQKLIFSEGDKASLGSDTIFDAVRNEMRSANRPTLTFIHGFDNSFVDSIEAAAWIIAFYGLDANVFVFSWPSIASPIGIPAPYSAYSHDRATAAASGPAIARTIRRLYDYVDHLQVEERCHQSIHLLCHSMGNYVMRNALQALMRLPDPAAVNAADPRTLSALSAQTPDPSVLRRSFERIVLAAADEDEDAFDDPAKLKYLPRLGRSVSVYHSAEDWVLGTLSAVTKFNGPRLGNDGPDNMDTISDKVASVDVGPVVSLEKDTEGHQYYRIFPAVRDDIVAVFGGTPQGAVPNREPISAGRWRIVAAPAAPKSRKKSGK